MNAKVKASLRAIERELAPRCGVRRVRSALRTIVADFQQARDSKPLPFVGCHRRAA